MKWFKRHKHTPVLTRSYFIGPRAGTFSWMADPQVVDEFIYGVTVFNWKCSECGEVWITRRVGKHTD